MTKNSVGKVTILWICASRVLGGAETATHQIATLLRERGHLVCVLCRADGPVERLATQSHLDVRRAPLGGAFNPAAGRAIMRALDALAPDIALVTTIDEWVWSCLSPRRVGTRLVLARHMALPLSRPVRWLAARRADAVVAVSEAVRQRLLQSTGIPAQRLHVIYNPVRFRPRPTVPGSDERARAREAIGLRPAGRWVGFLGGLRAEKGLRDVLEAVGHANTALGPTNLIIGGRSGRDREPWSVPRLEREFRLEGRLHYLGETDRVETVLTAADVLVVATHSRLSEALPATLIEAMACGTPVVAYATGGIPEIIGPDGRTGRLAKPDDARDLGRVLTAALSDLAGAERMAAAGLARARQMFDPQRAAERYERLFVALRGNEHERSAAAPSHGQ